MRRVQQLKKVSDTFHTEHEAARIEAGVPRAETARYYVGRVIAELNVKIADTPATTLPGLAVKGRSELAWLIVNRAEGSIGERHDIIALFENLAALGDAREGTLCA